MASQTPEMDEIWKRLSIVLDNIFRLDSLERKDFISQKDFKDLYNIVANYFCQTGNEFENLHLKYSQKSKQENETIVLPGVELYSRVTNLFRNYLQSKISNNNGDGEIFLEFYAKTWEIYQKSSHIANCILGGLHKSNTVRQQINDANKQESQNNANSFNDIYTVAMHIWQDIFFKDSNQSLTKTCLKLITKERDGERINARLIKQVVDSYVSAGFTEKNAATRSVEQTLLTYNEYFEKIFLEETKRYYTTEVTNFPAQNSTVDYARKVYQRFDEEENRVKNVLHEKTMEKVQTLLIEIFIENQIINLQEELIKILRKEKIDEISLLFNLVNRIPSAHDLIIKDLESFAKPECLAAIQTISSTANRDPKTYCEEIIIVYSRFAEIVEKGFCNHQSYRAVLDKIFGSVVNNNAVTQQAGRSTRSAELLAAYFDVLLRKGNKLGDLDIEEKFNQLMIIFNYIEDKDAFLTFYGKRLARRLVNESSASDDFEEAMILKLKDKCGFEYTSKLQQMFKDIRLSKGLIEKYKENCQSRGVIQTIDLYVMVLSSNAWPFVPPAPFDLPIDLRRVVDSFTNFHTTAHAKRKLEWLYQYCKGELQTLFTKQKYILQVSTYQMTILLLFNSDTSLTVEDILERTKIDEETLLQVLITLLKPKLLICSQINPNDINDEYSEKNIRTTYEIQVNENFKSPKVKINLNIPLRAIEKRENDRDNQQIDEGRKFVIQAAIVRTMKARQTLKHTLLMQEVIQQLSSRFQPKIPMIKKCIDSLIEKEYLARDPTEKDQLRYLA